MNSFGNTDFLTNDVPVFTEKEMSQTIEIGKVYRPAKFNVILLKQGEINLKFNLSDFIVKKNSLLFVLPNSVYEFSSFSSDISLTGLTFSRDFLSWNGVRSNTSRLMETFASGFQPFYEINPHELTSYLQLIEIVMRTVAGDQDTPFAMEKKRHGFLTLFYEAASLYRLYNTAYSVKMNRPQELSLKFLRLLSKHFREERSVQFYAEHLFVTPRHLSQTLKETTGRTAGEFIDRAVIMEAKLLLRDLSLSIGRVAEKLHFSDQFFFTKFFKKHTGLTPSQYRAAE